MRETRHFCIKPCEDSTLLQYAVELIELVGPALQDVEIKNPGVDVMSEILNKGLVIHIKPFRRERSFFSDCCRGKEEDKPCNDKPCDSKSHDDCDDDDDVNSLGMSFEDFKNRIDDIISRITGDSRKSSAQ